MHSAKLLHKRGQGGDSHTEKQNEENGKKLRVNSNMILISSNNFSVSKDRKTQSSSKRRWLKKKKMPEKDLLKMEQL